MARCKGCGQTIVWIQIQGESRMPCDPDLVTVYMSLAVLVSPGLETATVVTDAGTIVSGYTQSPGGQYTAVRGRISHFATCPHGTRFRKRQ